MSPSADSRLKGFVRLFNSKAFFEAHEVLEDLWREERGPSRDFYQGLIQIAAAFVHVQKHNAGGSRRLKESAFRYLQKYPDEYEGIPLSKLLKETDECLRGERGFPQIELKKY